MSNNRYQKTLSLALTQTTMASVISLTLVGCSVVTKNIQNASSDKGHTDPKSVNSQPAFHHGFGGDPDTFKLIDRMDPEALAAIVKDEEVAKKIQTGPKPSLIYTGKSLRLKDCSIAPKGANHIAEIWGQDYLVNLFVAPGMGIKKAMESLQEFDARGIFRPFRPVHPEFVERLKKGVSDEYWDLNAIRFRIADPSSSDVNIASNGGLERQTVPVKGQIKLNYELDRYGAKTDPTIASASFIHSIAINDDYIGEFIKDVFSIRQDPDVSGCDVLAMLNKYIRSQGLTVAQKARGSYFFLHANIFDTQAGINEWRFTEHKLVTNDTEAFTEEKYTIRRLAFLQTVKADLDKGLFVDKLTPVDGGQRDDSSGPSMSRFCNFDIINCPIIFKSPEMVELENSLPVELKNIQIQRVIYGAHQNPVGLKHKELALRIVPMVFPRFYLTEDFNNLELAQDKQPLLLWFSGNLSDFGKNRSTQHLNYDLISNRNGSSVGPDHPIRRHEESKTCAQCHASNHDITIDAMTLKLGQISSMNFRHIGFGDGGNRRCNPLFGLIRADLRASLSTYLLKSANGFNINGYSPQAIRKMPDVMDPFQASSDSEKGLDLARCFNVDGSPGSIKP